MPGIAAALLPAIGGLGKNLLGPLLKKITGLGSVEEEKEAKAAEAAEGEEVQATPAKPLLNKLGSGLLEHTTQAETSFFNHLSTAMGSRLANKIAGNRPSKLGEEAGEERKAFLQRAFPGVPQQDLMGIGAQPQNTTAKSREALQTAEATNMSTRLQNIQKLKELGIVNKETMAKIANLAADSALKDMQRNKTEAEANTIEALREHEVLLKKEQAKFQHEAGKEKEWEVTNIGLKLNNLMMDTIQKQQSGQLTFQKTVLMTGIGEVLKILPWDKLPESVQEVIKKVTELVTEGSKPPIEQNIQTPKPGRNIHTPN